LTAGIIQTQTGTTNIPNGQQIWLQGFMQGGGTGATAFGIAQLYFQDGTTDLELVVSVLPFGDGSVDYTVYYYGL
jgi:hypothetical protein